MKYIGENAIKKLISLIKGDLATKQPTITASGLLKGDGAGTVTAADTQEATLVDVPNGLLKGDGTTISAAVNGTDYAEPSVAFTVMLSASGWSGKAQTVSDARFLTGNYAYSVAPDSGSFAAYGESVIYADNVTTAGKMQFHCGEVPTVALTVNILRMEASA